MPTNVYLSQPALTINSVNLTDQASAATITYTIEALESTALSSSARSYTGGLQNNEISVTLYQSYAASSTEASIYALVGTTTNIVISPTSGGLTTPTATSPKYTLTGAYLESHTPINATLGELSTLTLTFRGGTLTKATT